MAIQLYGFWRSNAAFRVRVALALKGLTFEEIDVDILAGRQFDPAYAEVNPEHVVPTLVDDGHHIFQSLAIIEYLDEIKPEPKLMPRAPRERAYARALALIAAADTHPLTVPRIRKYLGQSLGADATAIEAWCRHWIEDGCATYERLLMKRPAAPFALGVAPTIADIAVAGQIVLADLYGMDIAAFPHLAALGRQCFALPAFAAAHPFEQPAYKAARVKG